MSSPEPVAVYDTDDPEDLSWFGLTADEMAEMQAWLRGYGIEPNDTTRVEIWLIDGLFARVFQYGRNEDGRLYCQLDHDHLISGGCEIARREPFDVPISAMPPVKPAASDRSVT